MHTRLHHRAITGASLLFPPTPTSFLAASPLPPAALTAARPLPALLARPPSAPSRLFDPPLQPALLCPRPRPGLHDIFLCLSIESSHSDYLHRQHPSFTQSYSIPRHIWTPFLPSVARSLPSPMHSQYLRLVDCPRRPFLARCPRSYREGGHYGYRVIYAALHLQRCSISRYLSCLPPAVGRGQHLRICCVSLPPQIEPPNA